MSANPATFSDRELESGLRATGASLAYPAGDLSHRVALRIDTRAASAPRPARRGWRRLAGAVALGLLVAAAWIGLVPDARTAVADFLGLDSVGISFGSKTAPPGTGLELGRRTSLPGAQQRVDFDILAPQGGDFEVPDEVWIDDSIGSGQVSFVYATERGLPATKRKGVGMLLSQFRGGLNEEFAKKIVSPSTTVEITEVNGAEAFWIEGDPHVVIQTDPWGRPHQETVRLAANTLLWTQGDVTLRLESNLTRAEALTIARSVR